MSDDGARLVTLEAQIAALSLAIALQVSRYGRVMLGAAMLPIIEERNEILRRGG